MVEKRSSVHNALMILKSFSMDNPEMGVTELAEKMNLAKSTIHRILKTLASEGFVYKNPTTNKYSLGSTILALTNTVNNQMNIIHDATPVLNTLTEKTGENAYLSILESDEVIYLKRIEAEAEFLDDTYLGARNPLHCTSSGQVFLAYLQEKSQINWLQLRLHTYTTKTITNIHHLTLRIEQIREQGYAVSNEEYMEGVISISAPIFNEKNEVIAAITVAGPVSRLGQVQLKHKEVVEKVIQASIELTRLIKRRKAKSKYKTVF
ncbi:IclR family transcriptional regulator [Alkalihalobacillus sp. 1P02AB]|uniref:IclR family transcriptional regulator n=1 Tax=Alkalihalobacillus sp. 1P02AB TaxID=3132260 RepID=UPI0039A4624F